MAFGGGPGGESADYQMNSTEKALHGFSWGRAYKFQEGVVGFRQVVWFSKKKQEIVGKIRKFLAFLRNEEALSDEGC